MNFTSFFQRIKRGVRRSAAHLRPGADQPTLVLPTVPSWAQYEPITPQPVGPVTDPEGEAITDQYTWDDVQRVRGYRPGPRLSHDAVVAKADKNIAAYSATHWGSLPAALVMSRFTHIFLCARAPYWRREGHTYKVFEYKLAPDGDVLCLSEQTLRWMFQGERIGV